MKISGGDPTESPHKENDEVYYRQQKSAERKETKTNKKMMSDFSAPFRFSNDS